MPKQVLKDKGNGLKAPDARARAWTFVGYPGDSLPENYRQLLETYAYVESPVHDADMNGDGNEKKAHIHFLLLFDGKKSFDQVKEISDTLHAPIPQKVHSIPSMVRYMIHLDNPEKAQYKQSDIFVHGNIDISDYFKPSKGEKQEMLHSILAYIREHEIDEICDLVDDCLENEFYDWLDVIENYNTLFISAYIKSRHHKKKEAIQEAREHLTALGREYLKKVSVDGK